MTTKEQRDIIEAYERGEEIELYNSGWIKIENDDHQFNFQCYKYRIKGKKWRAQYEQKYYILGSDGCITDEEEHSEWWDDNRYNFGNYFKTEEQAKEARELLEETLTKFHEEND